MLACLTLFQNGAPQVTIKARGRAISRAVDVAEIVRGRYVPDASLAKVEVGSETLDPPGGAEPLSVSWIDIRLSRGHGSPRV